ncbi:Hypothetical protein HVR_LOCUS816 [uncultured virus]|nr:Hypothetical protein HVR_LOCUS816 [uncultured virus]
MDRFYVNGENDQAQYMEHAIKYENLIFQNKGLTTFGKLKGINEDKRKDIVLIQKPRTKVPDYGTKQIFDLIRADLKKDKKRKRFVQRTQDNQGTILIGGLDKKTLPQQTKDVIVIGALDLIRSMKQMKTDTGTNPQLFPFQSNPCNYLKELLDAGWKVVLFVDVLPTNHPDLPSIRKGLGILEKNLPHTVTWRVFNAKYNERYIHNRSSASFAIMDPERTFNFDICRYTPEEIFGA